VCPAWEVTSVCGVFVQLAPLRREALLRQLEAIFEGWWNLAACSGVRGV
jgi:hypothetical protein